MIDQKHFVVDSILMPAKKSCAGCQHDMYKFSHELTMFKHMKQQLDLGKKHMTEKWLDTLHKCHQYASTALLENYKWYMTLNQNYHSRTAAEWEVFGDIKFTQDEIDFMDMNKEYLLNSSRRAKEVIELTKVILGGHFLPVTDDNTVITDGMVNLDD